MTGLLVDLFAGGGGASLGIERATGRPVDVAVNHWREALAVHEANHPHTRHLHCDVWEVDPLEATGGRPVRLLWASPDCPYHSKARGGKPDAIPRGGSGAAVAAGRTAPVLDRGRRRPGRRSVC